MKNSNKRLVEDRCNDELVLEHLWLAQKTAKYFYRKFKVSGVEFDDFIGTANVALCEAASRYDASSATAFTTYAVIRIRGAIFDMLRSAAPVPEKCPALSASSSSVGYVPMELRQRTISMSGSRQMPSRTLEPMGICIHRTGVGEEGPSIGYIENLSPELAFERKESLDRLISWTLLLPERERDVVKWRYLEEISFPEMSLRNGGINKSWYSRLHSRALDSLKKVISDCQAIENLKMEAKHV